MTSPTAKGVAEVRNALLAYAVKNYRVEKPEYQFDGTEVKTAEQYAVAAGVPVAEARARMGQKDVWGGAGATNVPVGVGTVPASRKKRRKRSLMGRARRLAGYKDCDCPPGQHTKDECDG